MLLHGDCLDELKNMDDKSIDLIYLDPPFFSQSNHSLLGKDFKKYMFVDKWNSLEEYLSFIKFRVIECHRILKESGSIFLHCDKSASHYLRVILDSVFGYENFRNEIIWTYKRWSNAKDSLQNNHQTIFFYTKTKRYTFNTIYGEYSLTTNLEQIYQKRERDSRGKTIYKKDEKGQIIHTQNKKGVALSDVWEIPFLNPKASERVGYPTQKPIALLERIIHIASNENDIILDPFCGSGTTLVASKLLNRRYIGIDISLDAIELSKYRLNNPQKTISNVMLRGEKAYLNKTEYELAILKSIGAFPIQRNASVDGLLKVKNDKAIAVKIQKEYESIEEAVNKLLNVVRKKEFARGVIIRTHLTEEFFSEAMPTDIQVINSYDLVLKGIFE